MVSRSCRASAQCRRQGTSPDSSRWFWKNYWSPCNGCGRTASVADGTSSNGHSQVQSLAVAIVGSRGGVGCTSLAVNLGCNLAQQKNHNVALIDLDLALGDSDVALDLLPDYTLADVAMNIDRLDMTFLRRSLCKHSSGLSLLPHPVQRWRTSA